MMFFVLFQGGYMNAKIQKLQEQYDQGEHLESG